MSTFNRSFPQFLKKHWGWFWFLMVAVVSFVSVLKNTPSGHYDIFSQAAQSIWSGTNPYLLKLPSGYFNYSPSAALVYYSLFAFFPYTLGLGLYMGTSLGLLIYSLYKFLQSFPLPRHLQNLFLFIISSELIGTTLNARFELVTLAGWLFAASWLAGRRHVLWAYFLLAALCNFKLQSLPLVGLLLIFEIFAFQSWRAVAYFGFSLLFWFAIPIVKLDIAQIVTYQQSMAHNIGIYVGGAWLDFQHVFRFFYKAFGVAPSWFWAQVILLLVGIDMAATMFFVALKTRGLRRADWLLIALGLGGGYASAFLPMSQSSAYILYTPLLFLTFRIYSELLPGLSRRILGVGIGLSYFFISIAYSDLLPKFLRNYFFEGAYKAFGVLLLIVLSAVYLPNYLKRKVSFLRALS